MKNYKLPQIVLVLLFTVLFFYACSSDSENPVDPNNVTNSTATLTLNGAGYSNRTVTLGNGIAGYSISDSLTAVQFSGKVDNDSLYFSVVFKGNQTGTINWNDENGAIIYRTTSGGNYFYIGITQGTTTVSSYGAVSGKIEGTLSGKLIEASSQAELNISGSFSAVRLPDM
ncbi:MAG TPA: hypothetical protein VF870_00750 [Ignavibacteriaceae bacterium]